MNDEILECGMMMITPIDKDGDIAFNINLEAMEIINVDQAKEVIKYLQCQIDKAE